MKTVPALALLLSLSLCAPLATGAEATFSANYAKARKNIVSPKGAKFDQTLGYSMQMNSKSVEAITACLTKYPGPQAVHGYFEFISTTEYRVVLQPASPFATCMEAALEGHRLPIPPTLPYVNPFDFETAPPNAG